VSYSKTGWCIQQTGRLAENVRNVRISQAGVGACLFSSSLMHSLGLIFCITVAQLRELNGPTCSDEKAGCIANNQ